MSASLPPVSPLSPVLPDGRPGWKTYAGAALIILGALCHPDVLAIMPAPVAQVLQAVGAALGLVGLRRAQAITEQKTDAVLYQTAPDPSALPNPLTGHR